MRLYPYYTFKIPDAGIKEILRAGRSDSIPQAVAHLQSVWDHCSTMAGYILADYAQEFHTRSVDVDVEPHFLALILGSYDPQFGDDAVPIYLKSTLEYYEQLATETTRWQFSVDITTTVSPAYIIHEGKRHTVKNDQPTVRMASIFPMIWSPSIDPMTPVLLPDMVETTIHRKRFGFTFREVHLVDDDPFEWRFREACKVIANNIAHGDGQEIVK